MYLIANADDLTQLIECWTEGETIFLTADPAKAETFKTIEEANRYISRLSKYVERYLLDKDQSEVGRPSAFQVLELAYQLNPV